MLIKCLPAIAVLKDSMDINYILQLDCRKKSNIEFLQEELRKLKPLSKFTSNIPLSKIERCLKVLCNKYEYCIEVYSDFCSADKYIVWRCNIYKGNYLLCIVYGCTLYECISKVVIYLYNDIKGK